MPRKSFSLLYLLFLVAFEVSGAQAVALQGTAGNGQNAQPNTWIATGSGGLTLMGTWTVLPGPTRETVVGTWTLVDAQGKTVTDGWWSASRSSGGWSGAWRAAMSESTAQHSGTWSAGAGLKATAPFADLFEKAVKSVVSGKWRYGSRSGSWSIRAFK